MNTQEAAGTTFPLSRPGAVLTAERVLDARDEYVTLNAEEVASSAFSVPGPGHPTVRLTVMPISARRRASPVRRRPGQRLNLSAAAWIVRNSPLTPMRIAQATAWAAMASGTPASRSPPGQLPENGQQCDTPLSCCDRGSAPYYQAY
ncbi:hypothetical protein [Streptomyces sp. NEAU-L66]|uniref:hypothetical protein n=1 Tax=Streptomyces sp. NEAU-L66 TaxID=3390812 RepID=UPI0039C6C025